MLFNRFYYVLPDSSRSEHRTESGEVFGNYAFVAPEGDEFKFKYEADKEGFRVESDALPTPPEDTDEVKKAKEQFFEAFNKALELAEIYGEEEEEDEEEEDESSEESDESYEDSDEDEESSEEDDEESSEEDDDDDDDDEEEEEGKKFITPFKKSLHKKKVDLTKPSLSRFTRPIYQTYKKTPFQSFGDKTSGRRYYRR